MQILIDCTTTQDEKRFNGIGQFTKNIVVNLIKNSPENHYSIMLFEAVSTLDELLNIRDNKSLWYSNVTIIRLGKSRRNNYLNKLWYLRYFQPVISKFHADYPEGIYFCPYFWRYFPAQEMKTVLFVHDLALPLFNEYSPRNFLFNEIRKFQYWEALNNAVNCAIIITNLEFGKQKFLEFFPQYPENQVKPIKLGINETNQYSDIRRLLKYLPEDWQEREYIIYAGGSPAKNKNSLAVLHGFKHFLDSLLENGVAPEETPYLVVAGKEFDDPKKNVVKSFIARVNSLNLADNVVFTGYYDEFDRNLLLSNAFAFIHLSRFEGFGLAVAEAMRCKTPVIAHNGSSYPEVVGRAGMLVDSFNYQSVADAIRKLYIDREFGKALGEKGYEKSLEYNWELTAKDVIKIFEQVAEK